MPPIKNNDPDYAKKKMEWLLERVEKAKGGCWLWTAGLIGGGYGGGYWRNQSNGAHRISYALYHGDVSSGTWVLHRCGVAACVNPDHLYLGTAADNARDRIGHGRQEYGANHWTRRMPERLCRGEQHPAKADSWTKGTRNGQSKLTESDVVAMRSDYASGIANMHLLAKKYGVNSGNAARIITGKAWKHVPGAIEPPGRGVCLRQKTIASMKGR